MSILKKTYENIIELTAGFRYRAKKPFDDRIVVSTYESLQAYVEDETQIYEGMVVSVVEDPDLSKNGLYVYIKRSNDKTFNWIKIETDIESSEDILELNGGNAFSDKSNRYTKNNAGG